jgi:hypothetical protein
MKGQDRIPDCDSELAANEVSARFDPFDHGWMAGFQLSTQRGHQR